MLHSVQLKKFYFVFEEMFRREKRSFSLSKGYFNCLKKCKIEKEPFLFFNLPHLVIMKILKEYVPVNEKAGVLSQILEFQLFLNDKNLWYEPTLNLFHFVQFVIPGWYIDKNNIFTRYYFSVDYFNLSFSIQSFLCTRNYFLTTGKFKYVNKRPIPFSKVKTIVRKFEHFAFISIEENDVLTYCIERNGLTYCFWIYMSQRIVYWLNKRNRKYLKNNKCSIPRSWATHKHAVYLTLRDDLTVVLECQVDQDDDDFVFNDCYKVLSPVSFQLYKEIYLNEQDMQSSEDIRFKNNEYVIFPVTSLTFSNIRWPNVSVTVRHSDGPYKRILTFDMHKVHKYPIGFFFI